MTLKARLHFHNMDGSDALCAQVDSQVAKLERFFTPIHDCEVTVTAPHHHQHRGVIYAVMIKLLVPGETLVVNQSKSSDPRHEDCYVAIHDAFRSVRRRLQDYAQIRRREVKRHAGAERRGAGPADSDER